MENYAQQQEQRSEVVSEIFENKTSKSKFYTQIFLYFGLGILLTGVVSLLTSWIFGSIWPMSTIGDDGVIYIEETSMMAYSVLLVVSAIALLIVSFVITFKSLKGSGSILVPYILYSVIMGIMLSSLSFFIGDAYIIGCALLITAVLFVGMAGIGYLTHNKLATWTKVLLGFSIAVILLTLLNLVIIPFGLLGGNWALFEASIWLYLLVEVVMLVFILIMVAVDMARIRTIAEHGAGSKNLALYCALNLYSDFISLFIYILRFLLVIVASSRNN